MFRQNQITECKNKNRGTWEKSLILPISQDSLIKLFAVDLKMDMEFSKPSRLVCCCLKGPHQSSCL